MGLLLLLIVAQNLYWMKICYDLNNKLMSRNYYEYNQAQALKAPSVQKLPDDDIDYEAERQAREANSLMGVV